MVAFFLVFLLSTQTSAGRLTGQPEASKRLRLAKNCPRLSLQLATFADSTLLAHSETSRDFLSLW
jgi:hypothetical protein